MTIKAIQIFRICAIAALLASVGAVAGCGHKPRGRALLPTVRKVYVPMFETRAYEPGLEERLTQKTIDEFLIDGRVKVVRPQQADLILVGRIEEYEAIPESFSDDEFVLTTTLRARARVVAYGPDDPDRTQPVFLWNSMEAEFQYVSDKRFIIELAEVDAREDIMDALAIEIVRSVMEDEPDYVFEADEDLVERLEDPGPRFRSFESLRDRRKRSSKAPPLHTSF